MQIHALYVSDRYCERLTEQSCDASEILIRSDDGYRLLSHRLVGGEGCVEMERADGVELRNFPYALVWEGAPFSLDRMKRSENGRVDGIRFVSGGVCLFVFASEDHLVLTQTVYDLFEELDTPIPCEGEDIPLRIKHISIKQEDLYRDDRNE